MELKRENYITNYVSKKGELKRIDLEWFLENNFVDSIEHYVLMEESKAWSKIKNYVVGLLKGYLEGYRDFEEIKKYIESFSILKTLNEDILITSKKFVENNRDLGYDYMILKVAEEIYKTIE